MDVIKFLCLSYNLLLNFISNCPLSQNCVFWGYNCQFFLDNPSFMFDVLRPVLMITLRWLSSLWSIKLMLTEEIMRVGLLFMQLLLADSLVLPG